jgi:transcriptional regulator with XRE-family HTH domain
MKQTLGSRIRELRELKDLSLREFAKKLDTSAAHMSDIELGRRFPSEELLGRIARTLGAGVEDLRQYDYRPPVEDIKRISESNPEYAFAFRRMVETKVTPAEILAMIEKKRKGTDK